MKLVKKLMESIREYKTASILTPVYVTVEVIMEVLIPFVMASLIDKGIEAGSMSVIWKYGIILLVLAMIALAFGYEFCINDYISSGDEREYITEIFFYVR